LKEPRIKRNLSKRKSSALPNFMNSRRQNSRIFKKKQEKRSNKGPHSFRRRNSSKEEGEIKMKNLSKNKS
jgi:hypothetical protein